MTSTKKTWETWAYGYFLVVTALVFLHTTLFKDPYAHYAIFTQAANAMFSSQDPHAVSHSPIPYGAVWLYSPSAALFFLPFAKLPEKLGYFLYLALSLGVFLTGLHRLLRIFGSAVASWGFCYLVLSSEIVGATQQAKLEILATGILFWVASFIAEKKFWALAGALLAWTASWKFQTLPVAGLLAIGLWHYVPRKGMAIFLGTFAVTITVLYLFPWVVFPRSFADHVHQSWFSTLKASVELNWPEYNSLYAFFYRQFDWNPSTGTLKLVSAFAACLLALATYAAGRRSILTPFALGVSFTMLFSPLTQGSGFIFAAPAVVAFFAEKRKLRGRAAYVTTFVALFYWLTTSLFHGDLFPAAWRSFCGTEKIRPIGMFVLLAAYLIVLSLRPEADKKSDLPLL